jgi:hypothetical protein
MVFYFAIQSENTEYKAELDEGADPGSAGVPPAKPLTRIENLAGGTPALPGLLQMK